MTTAFIHWNIAPEAFTLFGIPVRYYGLLFVGGFIVGYQLLEWMYKREGIPYRALSQLAIYVLIGAFAGARLGHCLFYEPDYFLYHPLEMFLPVGFTEDGHMEFRAYTGLASHGGAFGILLGLLIYKWRTGALLLPVLDRIAIATPIACVFIRLANFFNSEIIGYPTDVPWAIVFEQVDEYPRHPAQLYEAIFYLLLFVVMLWYYLRNGLSTSYIKGDIQEDSSVTLSVPDSYRGEGPENQTGNPVTLSVVEGLKPSPQTGFYFAWCIIGIFAFRFVVEFIKERQVDFEYNLPIDMGQILSIPFILLGIGILVYGRRRKIS